MEIINVCGPKMCCGYQAKKEISDTLVDVGQELLIVNQKAITDFLQNYVATTKRLFIVVLEKH